MGTRKSSALLRAEATRAAVVGAAQPRPESARTCCGRACSAPTRNAGALRCLLLLRAGARCFYGVPVRCGRQRTKRPAGAARGIAPLPLSAHGCAVSGTRPLPANPPGRMPGGRSVRGALLFGYFLLGTQEKVTRLHGCRRNPAGRESVSPHNTNSEKPNTIPLNLAQASPAQLARNACRLAPR
jgi:hypothetical protein